MTVDFEDAVQDIVDFLESADWDTIISAIDSEKGDFTLDAIGKFYFGERTLDQLINDGVPVLVVEPSITVERHQESKHSHEDKFVDVSIFARADITGSTPVEVVLLKKVMRYERAFRTLMRANPALGQIGGGYIKNITFAGTRYTGVSGKGNIVFRAVVVRLKIFAIETWT